MSLWLHSHKQYESQMGNHVGFGKASRQLPSPPTNQPTYPPHPIPQTRERARESRSKRSCHPQSSAREALFPVRGWQSGFNMLTLMQDPGAGVKKEDAEEETAAVRWHVQKCLNSPLLLPVPLKVALASDHGSSAYLMPLIGSQQSRVSTW